MGSIFFGLFVDTNEKDLALGELERLWKRKKERKKERDILKKKGKKFFESLSLAREAFTHVRPKTIVFSFFFIDLRDDFDDI